MNANTLYTLHNIQILRAFAAIMVVLHHSFPQYEAMGGHSSLVQIISTWGFFGVDIFFIISGFIMAYTTFNKKRNIHSAKIFFKHRLYRIYLGYWPFFFMMLLIIFVVNPQKLSTLDIFGSFTLSNPDMFQLVLPISWSLSYELYFYCLFLFTFAFSVKQLYIFIPVLISLIMALALYAFFTPKFPTHFAYSPFLLEFFAGVLLYMYKEYLVKIWILPISLIAVGIALWYGVSYETKNGLLRILTFGTAAFSIVTAALILEQKNFYLASGGLESLGNASYTLYLSHLVIIELFYLTKLRELFTNQSTILPLAGLIFLLSLCIIFSLIYYQKIEKPVYQRAIRTEETP